MDIAYKPREEDDQGISDILSKLGMYLTDQNKYPWKESQMFADGLIQQRGYLNVKMDFTKNVYGDICIENLDPLDVMPDPDAKSYDPDDWADVIVTISPYEAEGNKGIAAFINAVRKKKDVDRIDGFTDATKAFAVS